VKYGSFSFNFNDSINYVDIKGDRPCRSYPIPIHIVPFAPGKNRPNVPDKTITERRNITSYGGFTVVTPHKKCCCNGNMTGNVVLVQLFWDKKSKAWRVDAKNEEVQRGKRKGNDGIYAYTDTEPETPIRGEPTMNGLGYVDTPGINFDDNTAESYEKLFRVEAYCRCNGADIYLGSSLEFTADRSWPHRERLSVSNIKADTSGVNGNPSKYPKWDGRHWTNNLKKEFY
jgi:hypothetical protein